MPWITRLADRLRPRSDEGDVYRNWWIEGFELILDVFGAFLVGYSIVLLLVTREWLVALWYPAAVVAVLTIARFVFFRPHLVVGPEVVILVGVVGTRRIEIYRIREAVAVDGGVQLVLIDGTRLTAPGLRWSHTEGGEYRYIASEINRHVAERFGADARREPPAP